MKTKTKKLRPNVRLLRKIQKHILEEPRRLNMRDWAGYLWDYRPNENEKAPCGTVGCIAGWAAHLSKRRPRTHKGFAKIGAQLLRLAGYTPRGSIYLERNSPADRLFVPEHWPARFYNAYVETEGPSLGLARFQKRAQITSDRIDHFIATGE